MLTKIAYLIWDPQNQGGQFFYALIRPCIQKKTNVYEEKKIAVQPHAFRVIFKIHNF